MNFEELQAIWNTQKEQPMFAIDRDSMHALIQEKTSGVDSYVKRFEWTMIVVPLLMATILFLDAWREGEGWDQYVVAVICLLVGMASLVNRMSRSQADAAYDQSIKGVAQRAIDHIDRHVRRLNWVFWAFHMPIAVTAAIGLTVYSNTRTPLIWGGVMAITAVSYWGTRRDAQIKLQEKDELKQLLVKLGEAGSNVIEPVE